MSTCLADEGWETCNAWKLLAKVLVVDCLILMEMVGGVGGGDNGGISGMQNDRVLTPTYFHIGFGADSK